MGLDTLFYQSRKSVIPSRWTFLWVSAPWIGTSNVNTLTVTSWIPHFLRGIWAQCRGILGVQYGKEYGFFLHNVKALLVGILLTFNTQETYKCPTHNPGLHPRSLTMTSVPSHGGPIFNTTALLQLMKMKGGVANDLISRHHCSQHAAD